MLLALVYSIEQEVQNKNLQNDSEKEEEPIEAVSNSKYPFFTPEHLLWGFFCLKYGLQENIKNVLNNMHDDLVNKDALENINGAITKEEIALAQKKIDQINETVSLDELWTKIQKSNIIIPYENSKQ